MMETFNEVGASLIPSSVVWILKYSVERKGISNALLSKEWLAKVDNTKSAPYLLVGQDILEYPFYEGST